MKKGTYKHTVEAKIKIAESNRRRFISDETKRKIGKANTVKLITLNCLNCLKDFSLRPCEIKNRLYCSSSCVYQSKEYRAKRAEIGRRVCTGKMGEEHPAYKDREKIKYNIDRRHDTHYLDWRKEVYKRDSWKCKIGNNDCKGHIQAHHILNWIDYPELRYETNNGITLCFNHHPRGRVKEKQMSPYLQDLIKV